MPEEEKKEVSNFVISEEEFKTNYVHKKVVAAEWHMRSKESIFALAGMMVMTFFCAVAGLNWYSILLASLSIGWGLVHLVKVIKLRSYLEETYGLKNE